MSASLSLSGNIQSSIALLTIGPGGGGGNRSENDGYVRPKYTILMILEFHKNSRLRLFVRQQDSEA